jgi:hypothetical protein
MSLTDDRDALSSPADATGVCEDLPLIAPGSTLGMPDGVMLLIARGPDVRGHLRCNGVMLQVARPPACSSSAGETSVVAETDALLPGAVFIDPMSGLTAVCTRAGRGRLEFAGRLLRGQHRSTVSRELR